MKKIMITIAIPTYKRTDFLGMAVDSAVNQEGTEGISYEVIVIDNDAGEEVNETQKMLEERYSNHEVVYYKNPENVGLIGNLNRCLELARGKWVVLLHDDDMIDSNYLVRIKNYLDKYNTAKCIIPNVREIDEYGRIIKDSKKNRRNKKLPVRLNYHKVWKVKDWDNKVMNFNFYGPPSCGVLLNRKSSLNIGGFSESVGIMATDWDFFIRFSRIYNVYKLNEILGSYRWAVNTTLDVRKGSPKKQIEQHYAMLEKVYGDTNSKIYKKFKDLNIKMVSWEWCRRNPEASKYTLQNTFSGLEVSQFYIWAFLRRVYMYFREAFIVR